MNKGILRTAFTAVLALAVNVAAQTYSVTVLNGLGSGAGGAGANSINDRGWVAGQANNETATISHAALWIGGPTPIDLGALGGANANSAVAWPVKANNGVIVGISDTAQDNPLAPLQNSFSCWPFFAPGAPTGKVCRGFRWEKGVMTALPAFPGGYNSYATAINSRGQIVGWAENSVHDPTCDPAFQTLQFHAVIWGPKGEMQELPPLLGDSTSAATAINDKGQVVGISGDCGIAVGGVSAKHAVIWENGVPRNLGDLGGHAWNTPTAINDDGLIVGFSLPANQDGTANYQAVVWTSAGIRQLNTFAGTTRGIAYGFNGDGKIVGYQRVAGLGARAVVWENANASVQDLNNFVPAGTPTLIIAGDVNGSGGVAGYTANGFGFQAIPK
jgi:probable HAF family extracellular repeat protein